MNRIIVIGNGFDLAHGLKTGYQDFINDYWEPIKFSFFGDANAAQTPVNWGIVNLSQSHNDEFLSIYYRPKHHSSLQAPQKLLGTWHVAQETAFANFAQLVDLWNRDPLSDHFCIVTFKNHFFERLTQQLTLQNWVDIENAYYKELTNLLHEPDEEQRKTKVRTLNQEFEAVKMRLETYLSKVIQTTKPKPIGSIDDAFHSPIYQKEIAHSKRNMVYDSILTSIDKNMDSALLAEPLTKSEAIRSELLDHTQEERQQSWIKYKWQKYGEQWRYAMPSRTLILNFNYTNTPQLYSLDQIGCQEIHIHGELNNPNNPIIFGYGDELDDHYLAIEKLQDNEFLRNIKSMWYLETDNYRQLLEFIESDPYQVFIMGHSCGNSDRTLLNTLFEHPNCFSIKIFYHQKAEKSDDYNNIVRNISRNFNNKAAMRTIVVNHTYSSPLVPWDQQNHENQ